jgi:6-phosphogluconolactonase (cycloisomerase 2 family)
MATNCLYTVTNRQRGNAVVGMTISPAGTLARVAGSPFLTGGLGSHSSQSQNGVWIDQGRLYAVDFGSQSFAIFKKNDDGTLTRLNRKPIASRGVSPCSLTVSGKFLYVVNQHIRSSGGKAEPSLTVFAIKGKGPRLQYLAQSSFKLPRGESPTQVIVNRQGTLLAIPSVRARRSVLHVYRIQPADAARGGLLVELAGSPFAISDTGYGFGSAWASNGSTFYMTNAIGAGSVVTLAIDGQTGQIVEKARATTKGNACWTALSRNGKRLYVTNLLSLLVFDVSRGRLKPIQTVDVTDVAKPVLRDVILTPDGRYLFALEQRKRRILGFKVGRGGRVTPNGELAVGVSGYTLGLAIG